MKKERFLAGCICFFTLSLMLIPIAAGTEGTRIRSVSASDAIQGKNLNEEDFHILLIGQDERPGEPGKRSDSLILCSFQPGKQKMILTSFLRDLYVKIPGYGYERLNAAYAMGGPELLDRTLEENFGVRVDGNIEVDFDQFSGIIDQLGGVQLELRADEAREISRLAETIGEGMQRLNGRQALVYARIRKLDADSDFSRTLRQRKLLTALAEQYRSLNFPEMVKLCRKILPAITTDLNGFEILTYGKQILPMLKNMEIESSRVPQDGTAHDETIRGMQVLKPDLPAVREKLKNMLEAG